MGKHAPAPLLAHVAHPQPLMALQLDALLPLAQFTLQMPPGLPHVGSGVHRPQFGPELLHS